ncbi:MAG: phosphatase PAP2 family protein [Fimbriimonadales bacterium]
MEWLWGVDREMTGVVNQDWHSPTLDTFFRWITYLGLDQVVLPLVLILILVRSQRLAGFTCLLAYAIGGVSAQIIKRLAPRFRPGSLSETIVASDERIFLSSFPSGHTVIAFAVAFALLLSWPGARRTLVGTAALVLALGVALSRIYRGVHWPTDIVGSISLALIAAAIAHAVVTRWGRSEEASEPHPLEEPA